MPLQCDPTVIYALSRAGRYDGNIHQDDLSFDSPYNTYRYPGPAARADRRRPAARRSKPRSIRPTPTICISSAATTARTSSRARSRSTTATSRSIRCSTFAIAVSIISLTAQTPSREVAITFDDLPIAGVLPRDIESSRELTRKLLAAVAAHHVPAIGFVNEDKLNAADGTVDPQRVDLLRRWLDAGLELGNHAYSHPDLHSTPLEAFEADVLKGERVIRPLMASRGLTLRFFRHPFLHTGRDLETRARLRTVPRRPRLPRRAGDDRQRRIHLRRRLRSRREARRR